MIPLPIFTNRLHLRSGSSDDAKDLFHDYFSSNERSKYLTRRPHICIDETLHFLKKWCDAAWKNNSLDFSWVISLKRTNKAIGIFLVLLREEKAQIHYGISRQYEGQGLITEAGIEIIQWLKVQSGIKEIWTVCDIENYGSIKVLEKWGFEKEGLLQQWLHFPAFGNAARDCYKYKFMCGPYSFD